MGFVLLDRQIIKKNFFMNEIDGGIQIILL